MLGSRRMLGQLLILWYLGTKEGPGESAYFLAVSHVTLHPCLSQHTLSKN